MRYAASGEIGRSFPMSQDADSQAAQRYEEFVQLFARHEAGLRGFVRSLLPTWADVDEVIQETCLVLWRKFDTYEPGSHFPRWACTIARFEVLKYRRKLSRERHVFNDALLEVLATEAIQEAEQREQERRALAECIQKLPPRQRDLVRGCYASEQTIREVAEEQGRSATSVYKALNRIRQVLLECIQRTVAAEGVA
jgi:RNA polymerase sigma-70 factor (ECF subfamily)